MKLLNDLLQPYLLKLLVLTVGFLIFSFLASTLIILYIIFLFNLFIILELLFFLCLNACYFFDLFKLDLLFIFLTHNLQRIKLILKVVHIIQIRNHVVSLSDFCLTFCLISTCFPNKTTFSWLYYMYLIRYNSFIFITQSWQIPLLGLFTPRSHLLFSSLLIIACTHLLQVMLVDLRLLSKILWVKLELLLLMSASG